MERLKGSADLIFAAVLETTNLVERMHRLAAEKSMRPLLSTGFCVPVTRIVKATHDTTAGTVYDTIRGITCGIRKLIGIGLDLAITTATGPDTRGEKDTPAPPPFPDSKKTGAWFIDHTESLVNGLYGDFLERQGNALNLGMNFRHRGRVLKIKKAELEKRLPDAGGKVCVFIHGLICTESVWFNAAESSPGDAGLDFGDMLSADLGYTPLYIRYNTGRHVSENGRHLSALLTQLISEYPVKIEKIVLVGHSMGGLVARSASYYGMTEDAPWIKPLRHVFCIGSPNLGAPLEKGANAVSAILRAFDTPGTQAPARVIDARSAGIKDLRFGYTVDEEWNGRNPDAFLDDNRLNVPFADGVSYSFIGATITRDLHHPAGVLFGDLLVRLQSAAGHASEPARRIPFTAGWEFGQMNHMHLTSHPDVYAAIRKSLGKKSG